MSITTHSDAAAIEPAAPNVLALARQIFVLLACSTVLFGIAYPLTVTAIGGALFPAEAGGSLIMREGKVVGSALIGQTFSGARYFHARPSAAGAGYDAMASSGSNLAPTSRKLAERIAGDTAALRNEGITGSLPADAVTASGSGLDPDISPDFARLQVARVAAARNLPEAAVGAILARRIESPLAGVVGEPRVNVLKLNLDLDAASP